MGALPPDLDPAVRAKAWIGDAVLALYVREWILDFNHGHMDGNIFKELTSNQFLRLTGNDTAVEAQIGDAYAAGGLSAGFDWITRHLRPRMEQRLHALRSPKNR